MADLGLAGGIGQGLLTLADTYQKAKQQSQQNALNQQYADAYSQNTQAGLLAKGMQVQNGQVGYTPEMQAQRQAQMQQTAAENKIKSSETEEGSDYSKSIENLTKQRLEKVQPGSSQYVPSGKSAAFYKEAYKDLIPEQEGLKNKLDVAKLQAQAKENVAEIGNAGKTDKAVDKSFAEFSNVLDPNKGRAGNLAKLQEGINRADRLDALTANGNNLDSRQQEEYAIGLQALLGSGHPSSEQVKALVPQTAQANTQKLKEWLFNSPQGLNNQAFVDRMKDTVAREKSVMKNQLKDAQYGNIAAYSGLKQKDPERYNQILNDKGLDPDEYEYFKQNKTSRGYQPIGGLLGKPTAPSSQSQPSTAANHPQAAKALAWAKNHPDDPRAKDILNTLNVTATAGK